MVGPDWAMRFQAETIEAGMVSPFDDELISNSYSIKGKPGPVHESCSDFRVIGMKPPRTT
jgi:hypothetical protein